MPLTKRSNPDHRNIPGTATFLMYRERLDGFVLVSSDSDFTRLAQRLREGGFAVYGFGERKTAQAFRNACHRFVTLGKAPNGAVTAPARWI